MLEFGCALQVGFCRADIEQAKAEIVFRDFEAAACSDAAEDRDSLVALSAKPKFFAAFLGLERAARCRMRRCARSARHDVFRTRTIIGLRRR